MIVTPQKFRKKIQAAEVLCLYSFVHIAKPVWNWSWYFSRMVQTWCIISTPWIQQVELVHYFFWEPNGALVAMRMNPGRLGLPTTCRVAAGTTVRSTQWRGEIWRSFSSQTDWLPHRRGWGKVFFFAIFFLVVFFYIYIYSCYIYIYVYVCVLFLMSVSSCWCKLRFMSLAQCVVCADSGELAADNKQDSIAAFLAAGTTEVSLYGSQVAVLSVQWHEALKPDFRSHISLKTKNWKVFSWFQYLSGVG